MTMLLTLVVSCSICSFYHMDGSGKIPFKRMLTGATPILGHPHILSRPAGVFTPQEDMAAISAVTEVMHKAKRWFRDGLPALLAVAPAVG